MPIGKTSASENEAQNANTEIMQKFLKAAELGEAKEHLKKKLAEGTQFDFDAVKLINGTMTENDWQNLYSLQKHTLPEAAAEIKPSE
jgi:dethiobiotin synthetase